MKKAFNKIMPWLFALIVLFFLGRTLFANISQLRSFDFSFNLFLLVSSFILYGMGFLIQSKASHYILKKMGRQVTFGENLRYLLYSQFGSYIPGKVWLYVIRYKLLKKHGVSESDFLLLFAIEAVHVISSAGILAFAFMSGFFLSQQVYMWLMLLLAGATIVGLYPKIFYPVSNWLYRIIKRPTVPEDRRLSYIQLLGLFIYVAGYWLALAGAFVFFVASFVTISASQIPLLMGTFLLAYWLGIVALFTPSGLGVREGIISLLLTGAFPSSVAVIISLLTRVWSALNEILWAGAAYLIQLLLDKNDKQ